MEKKTGRFQKKEMGLAVHEGCFLNFQNGEEVDHEKKKIYHPYIKCFEEKTV